MDSFRFSAPEYYHRHKASDWYWAVGIIALSAIVTAILFNNILFAGLILLGSFSLAIYASRQPKEHDIEISNAGITVGKYRFTYASLESFWLEHSEYPRLLIKSKRVIVPHIVIPVENLTEEERDEIRVFLSTKLLEEEQTEPIFEQIMEYLGF